MNKKRPNIPLVQIHKGDEQTSLKIREKGTQLLIIKIYKIN